MKPERRNHYRVLHVQPEAPPEVIRSSYRALIARVHPDLGGDADAAARLNVAYAVLSDPEQRRRYDQTLVRRPVRSAAAASASASAFDPADWLARRMCPFCRSGFGGRPAPSMRCPRCDSPLGPAPAAPTAAGEIVGRRRNERHARTVQAQLLVAGETTARSARIHDISLTGLCLHSAVRIPQGTAIHVTADTFETVALTVGCRAVAPVWVVHARLLTLQMLRTGRGVVIDARA